MDVGTEEVETGTLTAPTPETWTRAEGIQWLRTWYQENITGGEGVTEADLIWWADTVDQNEDGIPDDTWDISYGSLLNALESSLTQAAATREGEPGGLSNSDYSKANLKYKEVFINGSKKTVGLPSSVRFAISHPLPFTCITLVILLKIFF